MARTKRKIFNAGDTTSYKFPVIKSSHGDDFYSWLNNYSKFGYKSFNNLITESLKLKFTVDNLKVSQGFEQNSSLQLECVYTSNDIFEIDEIDEIEAVEETCSTLSRTFNSIKR